LGQPSFQPNSTGIVVLNINYPRFLTGILILIRMRILLVGEDETIGKKIKESLTAGHEVITAAKANSDFQVDITFPLSIKHLYETIGPLDACVCTAVSEVTDDFSKLNEEELLDHMKGKLFGQINLVLMGQYYLRRRGSFTLTSGIFADRPVKGVTGGAIICGALHSFVLAASFELPRHQRINIVSPDLVAGQEEDTGNLFLQPAPVSIDKLVNAYKECIEGSMNGQILRIYE
jgi:hypothetical protein